MNPSLCPFLTLFLSLCCMSNCFFCSQIMGYKIFTHEIHSSYAARIDNFKSYDTVSKDIIQRWTYPLVPDVQFFGNSTTKLERRGVYRASGKEHFGVCSCFCMSIMLKSLFGLYNYSWHLASRNKCMYACMHIHDQNITVEIAFVLTI